MLVKVVVFSAPERRRAQAGACSERTGDCDPRRSSRIFGELS